MGLEGIISKRADASYAVGLRTRDWVKVKCVRRQEMVIGGFSDPQGSRTGFGALLLGVYEDGKLRYAGKVGTGFDDKMLVAMRRKLDRLEQKSAPFVNPPRGFEAKGAHWGAPKLVDPSFVALREDKKASEVVREKPVTLKDVKLGPAAPARRASKAAKADVKANAADTVAGVKLSHPDKQLFPEAELTKLDLARYYEAVAEWILPHVEERPLSLFRCPDGWNKQCFYQKHADKSVHESVTRVKVPEGGGKSTYFAASSLPALVALVQWGVIELHPWGSRMPHPEKPDRLIFDFDPADDVKWPQLVKAVEDLRALARACTWSCPSSRPSRGRKPKRLRRPLQVYFREHFLTDSLPRFQNRSVRAKFSSIICATRKARRRSPLTAFARGKTRRFRPRLHGTNSPRTRVLIISTSRRCPPG